MSESKSLDQFTLKEGSSHSWAWFSLHAALRMQAVNFFLVATASLTSAYSVVLNADLPAVSAVIAAFGAIITVYFQRFETRIKQLVKAAEPPIQACEQFLACYRDRRFENVGEGREAEGVFQFLWLGDSGNARYGSSRFVAGAIFGLMRAVGS